MHCVRTYPTDDREQVEHSSRIVKGEFKTQPSQSILIVEDNDDDFESTYDALREESNFSNPIYRAKNGAEALDFLYHRGQYDKPGSSPRPGLVLLDLNMPGVDGRTVLNRIKSDASLKSIPVIVFSTSANPVDVDACYNSGANSYVQKPVSLEGLINAIRRIKDCWFEITILPKG